MAEKQRRRVRFAYHNDNNDRNSVRSADNRRRKLQSPTEAADGGQDVNLQVQFDGCMDRYAARLQEEIEQGIQDAATYLEKLTNLKQWFETKFQGVYLAFRGLVTAEKLVSEADADKPYHEYSLLFLAYMYANAAYFLEEEFSGEEMGECLEEKDFCRMRRHNLYLRLHNILAEVAMTFLKAADQRIIEGASDGSSDLAVNYMEILRIFCTMESDAPLGVRSCSETADNPDEMLGVLNQFGDLTIGLRKSRFSLASRDNPSTSEKNTLSGINADDHIFAEFHQIIRGCKYEELFRAFNVPSHHKLVFQSNNHHAPSNLVEHLCSALYQLVSEKISVESDEIKDHVKTLEALKHKDNTINLEEALELAAKYNNLWAAMKKIIWNICENIDRKFTAITSKFNTSCLCGQLLHIYINTNPAGGDQNWPDMDL